MDAACCGTSKSGLIRERGEGEMEHVEVKFDDKGRMTFYIGEHCIDHIIFNDCDVTLLGKNTAYIRCRLKAKIDCEGTPCD